MEDYMNLYCALDVILLAEIFTRYREMVIQHFKLDTVYYLGEYFSSEVKKYSLFPIHPFFLFEK